MLLHWTLQLTEAVATPRRPGSGTPAATPEIGGAPRCSRRRPRTDPAAASRLRTGRPAGSLRLESSLRPGSGPST
jgi:hypothetical protein